MREIFVPATVTRVQTLDPGELRIVELTLPEEHPLDSSKLPIRDDMRPGTAFLAKPFGARTHKARRRMYTRSNCAPLTSRVLETIINQTHEEKADTSVWWQSDEVESLQRTGGTVDVRVEFDQKHEDLRIYENTARCGPTTLRLEPDGEWEDLHFLGIAFSTGITPFLAHLRYMKALNFGRRGKHPGAKYTLIVSVRNPRQLMAHEELLEIEGHFPESFTYHPVLTREWPEDWNYTKGRIVRVKAGSEGNAQIDLSSLLAVVSDLTHYHVRMCGNRSARDQLKQGIQESGQIPLSFRAEVW